MPVNTAALKTFAPAMRRQLLEAVGRKLDLLLNSQTPDTLSTYAKQIAELREQEAENREQLLERVTYTWFNRLCALRYLDARGWHPFGCKVLMPAAEGETQPELLKLMRAGSLPAELKPHTNEARLHGLLDGQIPSAIAGADPQGEVYRELVLASCRSYHQLLPELFEGLDDASELLLPDDLLSEGSIAGGFRSAISDDDCEDVEIIGWLYQFYISEKKDEVIGKVVKSEDIPAATQLFTPNWIVKYMVQNTLGVTWLATYPDSPIKGVMEFYIEPAEQTPEVQAQLAAITPKSLDPEALTLIDPACGSGHILVEAYDLLKAIYLERGYRQRDIPELILTKNLYGIDICPRAVQMATFSLLIKGRADDRRLLERGAKLNIIALADGVDYDAIGLANAVELEAYGLQPSDLIELKRLFEQATTLGSLIQVPDQLREKLNALKRISESTSQDLVVCQSLKRLGQLVQKAELLAAKYVSVVANPPYMGAKFFPAALRKYTRSHYYGYHTNLFSAFIARLIDFADANGHSGIMTEFAWMFLPTYEQLRQKLLDQHTISTLIQLHFDAFADAKAHPCSFTVKKTHWKYHISSFISLTDFPGVSSQAPRTLEAIKDPSCHWFFEAAPIEFRNIPGRPIAYWVHQKVSESFSGSRLKQHAEIKSGIGTSDNEKFLRRWHEVDFHSIGFSIDSIEASVSSRRSWFPYTKGGKFRRWFGNNEFVVLWRNDGEAIKDAVVNNPSDPGTTHWSRRIFNTEYFFRPSITWGDIGSTTFSARKNGYGFIHDAVGVGAYGITPKELEMTILAFLNSNAIEIYTKILCPTQHFKAGQISEVPAPTLDNRIAESAAACILLAKVDWDKYERSWDFQSLPLLTRTTNPAHTLQSIYSTWITSNKETIANLKALEERSNFAFIESYGLQEYLSPEVPVEQITLTVNPAYRYGGDAKGEEKWARFQRDSMAELVSYATGCMLGRYSLDQPGLILADSRDSQAEQLAAYEAKVGKPLSELQFKPDPDGIIPVLDSEWFEDDIVARTREFLAVTFPESSVAENLRFIEESLGKDIRKYFCSEFYKDHLQTYKKRPIYWMVQSPKKGFSCLIYLHRYTKDTLNQVLNNYFRPYLQKLEARLAQLGLDQLNDDLPARERTAARKEAEKITKVLKECQAWEQDALLPLAQQRIELDLDDGVKVNYLKLQDVLAPIPGLAAKED
jgi:hypothetical protein